MSQLVQFDHPCYAHIHGPIIMQLNFGFLVYFGVGSISRWDVFVWFCCCWVGVLGGGVIMGSVWVGFGITFGDSPIYAHVHVSSPRSTAAPNPIKRTSPGNAGANPGNAGANPGNAGANPGSEGANPRNADANPGKVGANPGARRKSKQLVPVPCPPWPL